MLGCVLREPVEASRSPSSERPSRCSSTLESVPPTVCRANSDANKQTGNSPKMHVTHPDRPLIYTFTLCHRYGSFLTPRMIESLSTNMCDTNAYGHQKVCHFLAQQQYDTSRLQRSDAMLTHRCVSPCNQRRSIDQGTYMDKPHHLCTSLVTLHVALDDTNRRQHEGTCRCTRTARAHLYHSVALQPGGGG